MTLVEILEHLRNARKLASRDYSTKLPPVHRGEDVPAPAGEGSAGAVARPRGWRRRLTGASRRAEPAPVPDPPAAPHQLDIQATLRALPTLLDSATLPNGVVELLIEDFEAPTRQLFDIHEGCITLVEPGAAVPWASIAGPPTAWVMALGPERNVAELHLTGDERLARRVLGALPRQP